eukprot:COSAG05_NODE_1472_length_4791_cov_13.982413_3_plen_321_part_00
MFPYIHGLLFRDKNRWSKHSRWCRYEGHRRNCSATTPPTATSASGHQKQERKRKQKQPKNKISPNANRDLEPIFYEYGVDLYWAGHIHFYNRFHGPVWRGKLVSNGTTNPRGTIHVCTGNGGPPSRSGCVCQNKVPKTCVTCIQAPYSYTRLTIFNKTDLLWEQISNEDSAILDTWTVHQEKHGPFPTPPSTPPPPPPPPPPAPSPPLPPRPKPHGAPLPKGLKYECANDTMYTQAFTSNFEYYDYLTGFKDLGSCQAVCNELWNNDTNGCLAIEFRATKKHCVIYNGTSLTRAQWMHGRTPAPAYSVCMLAPGSTTLER